MFGPLFGPLLGAGLSPLLTAFGAGVATTALLLGSVLALLLRPLSAALHELCGTRERGQSWVALSCAGLMGGTLLAGLLGFGLDAGGALRLDRADDLFWSAVRMVQWATAATLLGLAVIAAIVLAFTASLGVGAGEKEQSQ